MALGWIRWPARLGFLAVLVFAVPAFFSLAGTPTRTATELSAPSWLTVDFAPAACATLPAPENRVCDFGALFNLGGSESRIDPRLLAAVAYVESGFAEDVIGCRRNSSDGAQGLMQFLPSTARERGVDPCDPASAIVGAAGYLRQLHDELDRWDLAVAGYNAGAQAVRDAGGVPVNGQTEHYVPDVMAKWAQYEQLFPARASACPVEPRGSTEPVDDDRSTRATQAMSDAVVACFGHEYGIGCFDERLPGRLYEHPRGRACDFMITDGGHPDQARRDHGQAMAEWVQANAIELNVLYVIWYDRVWNPSDGDIPWDQWRDYGGCANPCTDPSSGHFNHVHVSVALMPGDPGWAACIPGISCTE